MLRKSYNLSSSKAERYTWNTLRKYLLKLSRLPLSPTLNFSLHKNRPQSMTQVTSYPGATTISPFNSWSSSLLTSSPSLQIHTTLRKSDAIRESHTQPKNFVESPQFQPLHNQPSPLGARSSPLSASNWLWLTRSIPSHYCRALHDKFCRIYATASQRPVEPLPSSFQRLAKLEQLVESSFA